MDVDSVICSCYNTMTQDLVMREDRQVRYYFYCPVCRIHIIVRMKGGDLIGRTKEETKDSPDIRGRCAGNTDGDQGSGSAARRRRDDQE